MKNFRITFIALTMIFAMMSCSKQPEAKLTSDKTTVKVGEEITFTSQSTDADGYGWFGYSGPNLTTIAGGNLCDNFWKVKYDSAGTSVIKLSADNYSRGKTCSDAAAGANIIKYDETTITITVTK